MQFDSDTTAAVVVDMQNGFCHSDGSLHAPDSEAAINSVQNVIDLTRKAGSHVIFTRDMHPPEQFEDTHYYDEFDRWGEHVVEGTWEAEIVDELTVEADDHIVTKHTYDAFYQTDLEGHLNAHGIDDLLICGTLANVCVLHTASSAGLRDFRPVIIEDAVGFIEEQHRGYALDHADWLFGDVRPLDSIEFTHDSK